MLPKRLIQVNTKKIINTSEFSNITKYSTATHCWGEYILINSNHIGLTGIDWNVPLDKNNLNKLEEILNFAELCGIEWLWADMLCIDQSNDKDKIIEIPKMGDYYKNATSCLMYIPAVNLHMIKSILNKISTIDDDEELSNIGNILLKYLHKSGFLTDNWWKRVWTLQEFILSKNIIICSNNETLSINTLINIFTKIIKLDYLSIESLNIYEKYFIDVVIFKSNNEYNIKQVLKLMEQRCCVKVNDRIYGMLGLFPKIKIKVTYEKSLEEISYNFFVELNKSGDNSHLLNISIKNNILNGLFLPNPKGGNNFLDIDFKNCNSAILFADVYGQRCHIVGEKLGIIKSINMINKTPIPAWRMKLQTDIIEQSNIQPINIIIETNKKVEHQGWIIGNVNIGNIIVGRWKLKNDNSKIVSWVLSENIEKLYLKEGLVVWEHEPDNDKIYNIPLM